MDSGAHQRTPDADDFQPGKQTERCHVCGYLRTHRHINVETGEMLRAELDRTVTRVLPRPTHPEGKLNFWAAQIFFSVVCRVYLHALTMALCWLSLLDNSSRYH